MTDARSLSPRLPALKLRIAGQSVDPIEGGGGGVWSDCFNVWTRLPSDS